MQRYRVPDIGIKSHSVIGVNNRYRTITAVATGNDMSSRVAMAILWDVGVMAPRLHKLTTAASIRHIKLQVIGGPQLKGVRLIADILLRRASDDACDHLMAGHLVHLDIATGVVIVRSPYMNGFDVDGMGRSGDNVAFQWIARTPVMRLIRAVGRLIQAETAHCVH
jgi:hypothetical protein